MARHGGVKDSGEYFVISPITRKVTVPHAHKSIGTVGDHNSEQITFMCPQIVDGHDLSQCAYRYVSWFNVNNEIGHDELKVAEVEQGEEGMIYLTWTIRDSLTVARGIVQFSVHFEDKGEDGATLYRWSTATCRDCDILESINGVLGAYKAMYVSEDTLVISDYTPISENALSLSTYGIFPEGTLDITENGTYEVGKYDKAVISVDPPSGTLEITRNGTHDVTKFEHAYVNVPAPKGTFHITRNNTYPISEYEFVKVDVPVGVSGDVMITQNGTFDIAEYATAHVNVASNASNSSDIHVVNNSSTIVMVYYSQLEDGVVTEASGLVYPQKAFQDWMLTGSLLTCTFDKNGAVDVKSPVYGNVRNITLDNTGHSYVFRLGRGEDQIEFVNFKG